MCKKDIFKFCYRKHLSDVIWNPDVMVALGQNLRGLIAAHVIGRVCTVIILI